MTTQLPFVGSTSTLLQDRSEWASPAWCILRIERAREMDIWSMARKSPSSSGFRKRRSLAEVNQLLFLSFPRRSLLSSGMMLAFS